MLIQGAGADAALGAVSEANSAAPLVTAKDWSSVSELSPLGWGRQSCPLEIPQHVHSRGACGPEAVQGCGNCSVLRLCCVDFTPPSPSLGSLTLAWLLLFSGSHCKMEPHNGLSPLKLMRGFEELPQVRLHQRCPARSSDSRNVSHCHCIWCVTSWERMISRDSLGSCRLWGPLLPHGGSSWGFDGLSLLL